MNLFKQLDAWLEWMWNHSPPGKRQARRRERQMLELRWRTMQRIAEQIHTRIEHGRAYLEAPQMAALAARLVQLDTERTALETVWPDATYDLNQIGQDMATLQQGYSLLERWAQAAVAVALGAQDVELRIMQVQQAIVQLPASEPAPAGTQRRGSRSPELAQAKLAKIQVHLQRLHKRRQNLLQQPSTDEETQIQQLEKLADDFAALEQRGFKLWHTLAPEAFAAAIDPARQFQEDVAALRALLPPKDQHSVQDHSDSAGTALPYEDYTWYQSGDHADGQD